MLLKKIKIGNIILKSNIFMAPLAGYTNLATRTILRDQGCAIAYAEMVSAMGLKYSYKKSVKLIETNKKDTPLGVQLFGPDAESILNAFLLIKNEKFDLIDINCGCSIKKIIKAKAGACLLQSPDEIYKIIRSLKENTDKPVTIKIRSGWDNRSLNYMEILDSTVSAGADLITLHPRTRALIFKGKANWENIKELKTKSSIPVIGNGDIFKGSDAVRMMKETGCDGVMLARGVIENPFLVEEVKAALSNKKYTPPTIEKRITTMLNHCEMMVNLYGEKKGVAAFRKFIRGYTKGFQNISVLRKSINDIEKIDDLKKTIDKFFAEQK